MMICTLLSPRMKVFGDDMPCSLVNGHHHFGGNLYGRHPVVFIAKEKTLIQSNIQQFVLRQLVAFTCMLHVCYLFRLLLRSYAGMSIKNFTQEGTIRI
jgi:hypothetical protein